MRYLIELEVIRRILGLQATAVLCSTWPHFCRAMLCIARLLPACGVRLPTKQAEMGPIMNA